MTQNADYADTSLTVDQLLWQCFRHFVHLDHSNAAVHVNRVRYSPITFRLAEYLAEIPDEWLTPTDARILRDVVTDLGKYEEDKGR